MKKLIIILFLISLSAIFINQDESIIIPNQAIRFRVIANSNSLEDQTEKMIIKDQVEKEIYNLINGAQNVSEVRTLLQDNMNVIEQIVDDYNVPPKSYKGVLYQAGNYESLVITLGEGVGNNFWCVLFPPLCLLENSEEDISDVDYQLYVQKLIQGF